MGWEGHGERNLFRKIRVLGQNVASSLILKLTFEAAYELGKVFFYKKEKKKGLNSSFGSGNGDFETTGYRE